MICKLRVKHLRHSWSQTKRDMEMLKRSVYIQNNVETFVNRGRENKEAQTCSCEVLNGENSRKENESKRAYIEETESSCH